MNRLIWGETQGREKQEKVPDRVRLGLHASLMDAERTRSPCRGSSDRDEPPN